MSLSKGMPRLVWSYCAKKRYIPAKMSILGLAIPKPFVPSVDYLSTDELDRCHMRENRRSTLSMHTKFVNLSCLIAYRFVFFSLKYITFYIIAKTKKDGNSFYLVPGSTRGSSSCSTFTSFLLCVVTWNHAITFALDEKKLHCRRPSLIFGARIE